MNRKPIFDAVRELLGRGFRQGEVVTLDRAITLGEGGVIPDAPSVREGPRSPEGLSGEGIALIQRFEGFGKLLPDQRVAAYPDPGSGGDPWTIGWGSTGRDIQRGTLWTRTQCERRFAEDLRLYERQVADALGGAPTSQQQFDALVSFHYNTGAISRATLTRKHLAGDYKGAAAEFARWNKAGGRVLAGLTRRREAEAVLYRRIS